MFLNNWHIPNYSLSMTSHHTIQLETDFLYLKTTGLIQDFLKGQLFKKSHQSFSIKPIHAQSLTFSFQLLDYLCCPSLHLL